MFGDFIFFIFCVCNEVFFCFVIFFLFFNVFNLNLIIIYFFCVDFIFVLKGFIFVFFRNVIF